jgi:hypothetical protein
VERLVILDHGKIMSEGPPREVLKQNVSSYGLNLPPMVRFFKEQGWPGTPLTVEEALHLVKQEYRGPQGGPFLEVPHLKRNPAGFSPESRVLTHHPSPLH